MSITTDEFKRAMSIHVEKLIKEIKTIYGIEDVSAMHLTIDMRTDMNSEKQFTSSVICYKHESEEFSIEGGEIVDNLKQD